MTPEELKFREHIDKCERCKAAKKRVNDFCPTGLMFFQEWNPPPVKATLLSQEDSNKVIAEYRRKNKIHNNN